MVEVFLLLSYSVYAKHVQLDKSHVSLEKSMKVLENNQCPSAFYEIIEDTIPRFINSSKEKKKKRERDTKKLNSTEDDFCPVYS